MPEYATCLDCGYSLRGLTTSICNECGRAFIPGDESSYALWEGVYSWRKWARPPTLWTMLPLVLSFGLYVDDVSVPGAGVSSCLVYSLGVIFLIYGLADFFWRRSACRHDAPRATRDKRPRGYGIWRWFVLPTLIVAALSVGVVNWPMRLRFALSRAAFDRYQERFEQTGTVGVGVRWLGLYRVRFEQLRDDLMIETGRGFVSQYGFSKGRPTAAGVVVVDDVDSGWCVVRIE